MTRDDIIKMAHEAECLDESHYGSLWVDRLVAFATLVATAASVKPAHSCATPLQSLEKAMGKRMSNGPHPHSLNASEQGVPND